MILADTSIWVAHLRGTTRELASALENGEELCHPHIVGELACGNLRNRETTLGLLRDLRAATIATDDQVLTCIEASRLFGSDLGYTDVHLPASALLTPARLRILDGALAREARRLTVLREDA